MIVPASFRKGFGRLKRTSEGLINPSPTAIHRYGRAEATDIPNRLAICAGLSPSRNKLATSCGRPIRVNINYVSALRSKRVRLLLRLALERYVEIRNPSRQLF